MNAHFWYYCFNIYVKYDKNIHLKSFDILYSTTYYGNNKVYTDSEA